MSSTTDSSYSSKKRTRRKVLVFSEDFTVDEDDYLVIHDMLSSICMGLRLETLVRNMVGIEENDKERRVYKVDFSNLTEDVSTLSDPIGPLEKLSNLTHLDLCTKMITSLPPAIWRLENLTSLNLDSSAITTLPPSIGRLQNLECLLLSRINKLSDLPDEIWDLVSLKSLSLSRSEISSLPPSIGRLRNLKELDLSYAERISHLPEEIGDLTSLNTLYLNFSSITSLPASIGRLRNLKILDLAYADQLSHLPEEIGDLTSLNTLYLIYSRITSLPASIGRLRNLKNLVLSDATQISHLPEEIGDLTSLNTLHLSSSRITSLPASIGRLRNLKNLDLSHAKQISHLPEEIGDLTSLNTMNLRSSRIKSLPASIGRLQNLKDLNLLFTEQFSYLRESLRDPGIAQLSDSLGRMTGLMRLNLFNDHADHVGKTQYEFLLMLTKRCRSLGSLGHGMDNYERLKNPYAKELCYALACNRARSRTGFGATDEESIRIRTKLWPLILKHATRSFKKYSFGRVGIYQEDGIDQKDAIYQLLVDGRESFVGIFYCRSQHEIPSVRNKEETMTRTIRPE